MELFFGKSGRNIAIDFMIRLPGGPSTNGKTVSGVERTTFRSSILSIRTRGKPSAAWRNDNLRRRPLLSAGRVGRDGHDVAS